MISLVQTEVFDVLVALQEAEAQDDPTERVKLLGRVAKSVAELSRASVNQKKWQSEIASKIKSEAADVAASAAKAAGVSAETIAIIRRDVLGMAN